MISRREIDDAVREEKKSSKLPRLEDEFYQEAERLIRNLKRELEDSERGGAKYKIIERDLENIKNQLEKLFELRMWKIVRKAALQTDDKTEFNLTNLTREEKKLYHEIKNIIASYRKRIFERIYEKETRPEPEKEADKRETREERREILTREGRESEENKGKRREERSKETQSIEYVVIRAMQEIPRFRGIDMRDYTLKRDDIAAIPNINAKALCKRKIATKIEIKPKPTEQNPLLSDKKHL